MAGSVLAYSTKEEHINGEKRTSVYFRSQKRHSDKNLAEREVPISKKLFIPAVLALREFKFGF